MIVGLAFAMVAAYGVWCADRRVGQWLGVVTVPQEVDAGDTAIPDDLIALAETEVAKHAQDDMKELIVEKFIALRDWNKVRRAFGIGVMHG